MHRKPQLQEAARKLQEIINNRTSDVSYAQALDILSQLEGFEGYRQLREFVSRHSQNSAAGQVTSVVKTEPQSKSRPALVVLEPEIDFVRTEDGTLPVHQRGSLFPQHCLPLETAVDDSSLSGAVFEGLGHPALGMLEDASNRTTVVDLVLTRDAHDGSEKWENRLVEIELNPRKESS
jgi:hypothetical protein